MTDDRLIDRMQEVLDGTASPADTAALHALLARDADAAAEFAAWSLMFDGLSSLPMAHPPEGLVAAIDAAVPHPSRKMNAIGFQLFADEPVLGTGTTQTKRRPFGSNTISSWLMPASTRESRYMNTQQKFLAGGAAAVVALGLAAVLTGYPPKSTDVVGTVVPAERYRAPQAGAEGVRLGEQAAIPVTTTGSDTTGVAAAKAEAAAQADRIAKMTEADKMAMLGAADRQAWGGLSAAERTAKLSEADKLARLSEADRTAKFSAADRQAWGGLSEAERTAKLSEADKIMKLSEADRTGKLTAADRQAWGGLSEAERTSKLSEADKVMKLSEADKMGKLSAADRQAWGGMSAAERSAKLSEADRASALNTADKTSRLSEADRIMQMNAADKASRLNSADKSSQLNAAEKTSR